MRILVTGGAGFIGSHIADRLVDEGHDVVVIDSLATGLRGNVPSAARFIQGDVSQREQLEPAFAGRLDAVFHLAGQVSLVRSFSDPVRDLLTNVQGTLNVLQLCVEHRVQRVLYASSMTVYGNDVPLPTPESTRCEPVSYYGVTKYAAERYVHVTAQREDLDFELRATSFRMYNVYGPRQALDNPYQGVLGIFIGNMLRGERMTVFGDGEQSRDFIYIRDVVDAWVGALANPASYGQVFNLGSGRQLTINGLANAVLDAFQHPRTEDVIRRAPARSGEQRQVEADTTRARHLLGWQPRVSFAEGLAETIRWAIAEQEGLASRPRTVAGVHT
jgi:UDP-glucose 4-epimerase